MAHSLYRLTFLGYDVAAVEANTKNEQWKAPVSVWIREIYEERKSKSLQKQKHKESEQTEWSIDSESIG